MIAMLSSPAAMSALGFGFSEAARALRPTVSDSIWNLHCIIVNPISKPDEVRTARRRLLRLLETSKFQEMIVPPLALPAEPTDGATAATKRLDSTPLREVYNRPVYRGASSDAGPRKISQSDAQARVPFQEVRSWTKGQGLQSRQRSACRTSEFVEQLSLELRIVDSGMRLNASLMMPIPSASNRFRIIASSQPLLSKMSQPQVIWRISSPILVGTQPGSTELLRTSGQIRATAAARVVTKSLLSE